MNESSWEDSLQSFRNNPDMSMLIMNDFFAEFEEKTNPIVFFRENLLDILCTKHHFARSISLGHTNRQSSISINIFLLKITPQWVTWTPSMQTSLTDITSIFQSIFYQCFLTITSTIFLKQNRIMNRIVILDNKITCNLNIDRATYNYTAE